MADWPETAKYLTPEDRQLIKARIANEVGIGRMDTFNSRVLKRCFSDWKIWLMVVIYICTCTTTYAVNLFSPTIIALLNPSFTPRAAQARVIPIFADSAVAAGLTAYFSDRLRHRYGFAMAGYLVSIVGWIVLLCQDYPALTVGIKYMALYFVSTGSYMTLPLLWTLLVNNTSGRFKTAFATGAQIGLGNLGGVVASLVFESKEAPLYETGYRVCFRMIIGVVVLLIGFVWGLRSENGRRERGERDSQLKMVDAGNLGDAHPGFRYMF